MRWMMMLVLALLAGCRQAAGEGGEASASAGSARGQVAVSVDAVNYMHDWALNYTLTDLRTQTPIGGAYVGFLEGPGSKGCCVSLPARWQPGIKLRVEWQEGDMKHTKPETYRRDVEIPRYSEPGDVYVLFYPQQEVEVLVSAVEPGHPGWPGRVKEPAYLACVQRLGEKECRKLMLKYAIGSDEQFAADYRSSCQPDKIVTPEEQKRQGGGGWTKEGCERTRQECIKEWNLDKRMCEIDYREE